MACISCGTMLYTVCTKVLRATLNYWNISYNNKIGYYNKDLCHGIAMPILASKHLLSIINNNITLFGTYCIA